MSGLDRVSFIEVAMEGEERLGSERWKEARYHTQSKQEEEKREERGLLVFYQGYYPPRDCIFV